MALARGRMDDLRRNADRHVLARHPRQPLHVAGTEHAVTLRLAAAIQDGDVIARLAALDESSIPAGPVLLAFLDGEALAALSLTDGHVIADPFHRTAYLVDLLHAHGRQLERPSRMSRASRSQSFSVLGAQLSEHR
jgi:hypothetical protein